MMQTVNMLDAKSNLSRLVDAIEQGNEREIIIARNGKPAAKLVAIGNLASDLRIGVAKGKFLIGDDIDADNPHIAQLFGGEIA